MNGIHDQLYSVTLALSAVAATGSLLLGWLGRSAGPGLSRVTWLRRARNAAWLALALVAFSCGIHLAFGHRPGTDQALGLVGFIGEHPAFLVAAGAALLLARVFRPPGTF